MYNCGMKKTIACAALLAAAFAARAELERISLDGTWDFSFARDAKLSSATSDFKATDKMVVPGCFDLMPKWYAQRGLAHYRRTFALDKQTKDAWLVVKGMGLQAKFFIDGREAVSQEGGGRGGVRHGGDRAEERAGGGPSGAARGIS